MRAVMRLQQRHTAGRAWHRRVAACGLLVACVAFAAAGSARAAVPSRWAQLTETTFQHLTQEDGLPNEIAMAVAEDGDGFVWVGTLGGLARWDGYRLRVYKPDPRTAGGLPDNVIQTLHGDTAGRLWIGTGAAGLVRYDRAADRFVTLGAGPGGLSHVSVRSITGDGVGGLWVATDGGLDHLDLAGDTPRRRDGDPGVAALQGRRVLAVLRARDGALWVGTELGLLRRPAGSAAFQALPLRPGPEPQPVASELMQDSAGRVWVGTGQDGAFVVEADGSAPRPVLDAPGTPGLPLALQQVNGIVETQPGEVWIGTVGQGVVVVDVASGTTRRIRHRPSLPLSLADNSVRGLYRDRAGLVWVASNRGVSRHDPRQSAILTVFGAVGGGPGLAGTEISWILPGADDRLWLGTHKSGVEILDGRGQRVAALRPDPAHPLTALPADIVLALERVPGGSVYIATKRGLYHASADGRQVQRVTIPGRDPNASTWALLADGGTLWVGGQSDGLWQLDLASGRGGPVLPAPALTDQRIFVLAHGPQGSLWVGTRFGLNRVDPQQRSVVVRITPAPQQRQGLSAGFITTLHTDGAGRLWVGTYGGGINVLEPGGGPPRFRHVATAQGLPDDNVNALLEDGQGQVWASTDNGLAVIDPQTLLPRPLRRAEGVVFNTYWTGSAARTADGELLFGGAGGLTIVRPQQLQPWTYRPPVVVSELRVAGKRVNVGAHLGSAAVAPVTVPPDGNSLAVEFAAIDYSAPERIRYAYRLLGFDTDWVETDASRRLAAYNNLPPGRYTLQLRGSNRDGVWTEGVTALPVQVLPAWHQTLWFRACAVLGTLLAMLLVVRWRTGRLRAQQAELERKVEERTAELHAVSQALQEKSRVLEQSSLTDPLTGLHNRRFLTSHIDTEIAASLRRATEPVSASGPASVDTDNVFLLIDVDHFKRVNDLHGHAAGDHVLVQFGQRLRSLMRETDFLVRWGGEEFLAVARNTDRARAEELAERIREVVSQSPFTLDDGRTLSVSCSIGFACVPFVGAAPRALGWQDVVQLADLALLAAKRSGRDAWVGLLAGPAARADGLLARVQAAPRAALQAGEIGVVSSRDLARVAEALPAVEPLSSPST